MSLSVSVAHRYPGFTLDIAFEAPLPGAVALFGPSGSGKSSVMNAIAGLLRADACTVALDGEKLDRIPVERRRIGYVFQEGRLFPHLSVAANLRYGLRRSAALAYPGGSIGYGQVVDLLGLGALLRRRPHGLSGGERQRVAIGRALLSQPRLLLMDEPLSALDASRRGEILPYLSRLRTALQVPIVYASHALDEVTRLADTLVLIENGKVRASGRIGDVLARVDLSLAAREDAAGVLSGRIASHDPERGLSVVACGTQPFLVPLVNAPPGTSVRLRVPARDVILAIGPPGVVSVNNVVPAIIDDIGVDEAGHAALVRLEVGGGQLLARITSDASRRLALQPGSQVLALIKSMSVELMT